VVCEDRQITYAELAGQANQLAHALNELGVGPGDAVALLMENCVEYLVADQAIIRIGAAKVPLNSMLSPEEIAFIVADSGALVLIADSSLLQVAYQDGPRPIPHVIAVDDDDVRRQPGTVANWSWPDLLAHGYPASTPP